MDNRVRTELLTALRELRDEGPRRPDCGICENTSLTPEAARYLVRLFTVWPHYSGVKGFPVPSQSRAQSRTAHVDEYFTSQSHWDRRTRYGRLRWALLDWLIEQLEKGDG